MLVDEKGVIDGYDGYERASVKEQARSGRVALGPAQDGAGEQQGVPRNGPCQETRCGSGPEPRRGLGRGGRVDQQRRRTISSTHRDAGGQKRDA
jgi:hypothetical protein